tara:strand:+ start:570 stop:959 length:390 start_codon:yes stop_codon:yes gene_type:complete
MSWKDILKRDISFNPDEACCMELKRGYSELMRDLQEHYDRKGIKSNVAAMSRRRMNEPCKVLVDDLQSFYAEKGKEGSNAPNWVYYRISEILDDYGECQQEGEMLREMSYRETAPVYVARPPKSRFFRR